MQRFDVAPRLLGLDGACDAIPATNDRHPPDRAAHGRLTKIVFARAIARRAYRTVEENLFVGVGVVHVPASPQHPSVSSAPSQAAIIHLGPDVLVFQTSTTLLRVHIDTAPMRANASAANAAWLTPLRGAPARCGGSDTPRW